MNRVDDMLIYLQYFQRDWIENKIKTCAKTQENGLLPLAKKLLIQGLQKEGESMAYLTLFHLQSSLWTGSYQYKIVLSNETLYLDPLQVMDHWIPEHLYKDVDELRMRVEWELRNHYVRLEPFEVESVVRSILMDYQNIAQIYWGQETAKLIETKEFHLLRKHKNWKILFGSYMGELRLIHSQRKEEIS